MAKQLKSVRLDSGWDAYAKENSLTITELIEIALAYYKANTDPFKNQHNEIYKAVSKGIEQIEIKRDYGPAGFIGGKDIEVPELSPEEHQAHELYYQIWDDLRKHPWFVEPKIMDEETETLPADFKNPFKGKKPNEVWDELLKNSRPITREEFTQTIPPKPD